MANIYDQYKSAFPRVSAYVVTLDGEHVASIAFKKPKLGSGRVYAYIRVTNAGMVRGSAAGFVGDKESEAVADAARKLGGLDPAHIKLKNALVDIKASWKMDLERAGFTVMQAV